MKEELALNPTRSIYSVFGNICNNPDFLKSPDTILAARDFVQQFHKIVFIALNNLAYSSIDVNNITPIDIDNYLSSYPVYYKIWDDNEGVRYIDDAKNHANGKMFDQDYERLKKFSLLRNYVEEGIDVSDIYDYKTHDLKDLNESSHKLEEMSSTEIIEHYTQKMNRIREDWNIESGQVLDFKAGDDLDTLLERIQKDPDVGYPFQNGYYNKLFRGMRKGKFLLRSGATGTGKAISHGTKIPTPKGWRIVEDIKVGDQLFDRTGKPTNVIGVYPQGKQKVYRVHLKDGRHIDCNAEHLWSVYNGRSEDLTTLTTMEMIKGINGKKGRGYKYSVPINGVVDYEKKELPLNPYLLGVILGDGCVTKPNARFAISSSNDIIPNEVARILGTTAVRNPHNYNYHFLLPEGNIGNKKCLSVLDVLGDTLPELIGKYSHTKYIPEEYLLGSPEQRMELFTGLMDTDGSVSKRDETRMAKIGYDSTSRKLIEQIAELSRSLGIETHTTKQPDSRKGNTCYSITFTLPSSEQQSLFRFAPEKIERINPDRVDKKVFKRIKIKEIEELDVYEEQVCFTVDNEEHLFLVGDYVVTHNTRNAIRDMCAVACSEIYITGQGWVSLGPAVPSMFISTELDKEEVQLIMLAFITGISDSDLKDGNYDAGTALRVNKGLEVLKNAPLFASYVEDFSISDIEMKIEQYIINEGVQYVSFDYIQMTPKLSKTMQQNFGQMLREDQILVHFSAALKNIATRYNIFLESSTQLNRGSKEVENRDATSLRGGRVNAYASSIKNL